MDKHEEPVYIGAIDQGTSSSRFLIFDCKTLDVVTYHQCQTQLIKPQSGSRKSEESILTVSNVAYKAGLELRIIAYCGAALYIHTLGVFLRWVEQDPLTILSSVKECIDKATEKLRDMKRDPANIRAVGLTNQQITAIMWDKFTGKPFYNAIVWLDTRSAGDVDAVINKTPTKNKEYSRPICGCPITIVNTGFRLQWLLRNIPEIKIAADQDRCLAGTVDSWLLWNLTGGAKGGNHITDVTNGSFSGLMNIESLQWSSEILQLFEVPEKLLPQIRNSSEIYGYLTDTALKGLPISAVMGDSKSSVLGSMCFNAGQGSHIFGTAGVFGCVTGDKPVPSKHGCYTSVACKMGKDSPPYYALEGLFAGCGSGINWLRDNLGIINTPSDIEDLAGSVEDTHGCYVVPVFTGFVTPYWDDDARAIICGISQFTNKAHIARAFLEGVCFQSRQMIECVEGDSGLTLSSMRVSGGMTVNNLFMQLLADITGIPIERPLMGENTALGAALLAGAAEGVGVWRLNGDDLPKLKYTTFIPRTSKEDRDRRYAQWIQAVERSRH